MQTYYLIDDPFLLGWYFIFIIFIMYCIMPVSLHWCVAMCLASSLSHIITTLIKQPQGEPSVPLCSLNLNLLCDHPKKMSSIFPQLSGRVGWEFGLDIFAKLSLTYIIQIVSLCRVMFMSHYDVYRAAVLRVVSVCPLPLCQLGRLLHQVPD